MTMSSRLTHAAGVVPEECISGSLDLFSLPYRDSSIDNTYQVEFLPTTAISDSSTSILFNIPPSVDYTALSESRVEIQIKITKANGDDLDAFIAGGGGNSANSVGLIQLPVSSLFSSVNVRLNDQILSDSFGTYPFLSYVQCLLNFSKDSRESRLSLLGYYPDSNPNITAAHTGSTSSGFKTRASLTAESKIASFCSPIFHGLFSQTRAMIPLIPLSLEFIKSPLAFCLKSNATAPAFKYKIISMKLVMKKIKLMGSVQSQLENRLLSEAAKYPIRHSYCKPFFIDAADKQASFGDIFGGKSVPDFCAVALVEQTKFRGTYGSSPFQFDNFGLTSLKISFDSFTYPTPTPFQPDYVSDTQPNWMREYLSLFDGELKVDHGIQITYDQFKSSGFCIYNFTFGRETTLALDHTAIKRSGSARLDVSFSSTSTNASLVLLLYCESDELIQVDKDRKVYRDFHL